MVIGITSSRKHANYQKWITDGGAEVIRLGHEENNFEDINKCQGILLSGGEDVHPRFYKKPEYISQFHLDDIDEARDEFELKVLDHVRTHQLPLLGICRGLQITNVFFGGTLIADIVSTGKPDHTKFEEGKDRLHAVEIIKSTQLNKMAGQVRGEVNSAHHQGVDQVGHGLKISARSEDGIIEAMEMEHGKDHPFLLLVQWHPERMKDPGNPLTRNIREGFINAIKKSGPTVKAL